MKISQPLALQDRQDPVVRREQQEQQLKQASKMYEQYFIREMVKAMRSSVPEGGMMENSFAEKIWREQLDQQYIDKWSDRGGVGLAEMIFQHVKERYLPGAPALAPAQGPLPLTGEKGGTAFQVEPKLAPNSGQEQKAPGPTSFIFRGSPGLPPMERQVTNPWAGRVLAAYTDGATGQRFLHVQHESGLESRLGFMGQLEPGLKGQELAAGHKLGQLSPESPVLAWQVGRG